ncbi:ribosomal protein S5 domain 2-like superfamily protein [Wolffia australiana]
MGTAEEVRADGRTCTQLRPLGCTRNLLHRAHGSAQWSQGDTIVLAAVYGPKAGVRKGDNPEKSSIDVVWKPKTGQIGKVEKEYEMILRRTLQSICILTIHPNTTISVILQVIGDSGALLPCAINASCMALMDAGIPLKHLAVSVSCGLTRGGSLILDPSKAEEEDLQGLVCMAFPNTPLTVLEEPSPMEQGLITCSSHGPLSVKDYLHCIEYGRASGAKISEFLRTNLQLGQTPA